MVQCRAVGLTDAEALVVASHDQGMDDSPGTVANDGPGPHIAEEQLWHAIPMNGTAAEVLKRKAELFAKVLAEKEPAMQLKRLGVFFHYQQDTWAHRHHSNSHATNFNPFQVPLGHAKFGSQPDRPPFDPVCALRCLEEGVGFAKQFLSVCLKRTPNALFNNYQPASGSVDVNWNDSRKGASFHQLKLDTSTPARHFLTNLIRCQINAYTSSIDVNPNWFGNYTADEASYFQMGINLQGACSLAQILVAFPANRQKITTLITAQLGGKL